MAKKTRYGDFTFGWETTLGNMEAHAGELSHLESARLALKAFLDRVTRLQYEQRYHEAERLRATREMQETLAEGEKTATFLRMGIKLVYGNDNDQLLEFGIQPLRRRSGEKRKKAAAPKVAKEVTPELEPTVPEEEVLVEVRHSAEESRDNPVVEGSDPEQTEAPSPVPVNGNDRPRGVDFGSPDPLAKGPSPLGGGGLEKGGGQEGGGHSEGYLDESRPLTTPASG